MATPFHVLVIEDEQQDFNLVEEAFKNANLDYELHRAFDGEEAMEYLKKLADTPLFLPDLIILDWFLPKVSGKEILRLIKEDERMRRIPIGILTISEHENDIAEAYDLNANFFISKPFEKQDIKNFVNTLEKFWFSVVKLPSRTSKI